MGRFPTRHLRVPWDLIAPTDLVEQGKPEFTRDCRNEKLEPERHLGLHVLGTTGISLGILAIRCARSGDAVSPLSLAIASAPFEFDIEPAQRNPKRVDDDDEVT